MGDKHKENVKKEKESGASKKQEDEDLWRRLEELEVQEALENEWDDEESTEESESDEESDDESDEESEIESDENHDMENVEDSSYTNQGCDSEISGKRVVRRVSWAGVDNSLGAGNLIKFSHSNQTPAKEILPLEADNIPNTPSDLVHFTCQQPRSILKNSDAEILVRQSPENKSSMSDYEEDIVEPAMQERVL